MPKKRGKNTKPPVTRGNGGFLDSKRFNWTRAVPVILVFLVVGGFLVFRSSAGPQDLASDRSFSKNPSQLTGGKIVTKSNGVDYISINASSPISSSVTLQELENTTAVCTRYLMSKNNQKQAIPVISVTYRAAADGQQVSLTSGSTYDTDKAIRCIKLDGNQVQELLNSGATTAVISITLQKESTSSQQHDISGQIYSIYGLKAATGKFGYTWTQDNFMVPAASKAKIANIHMYGWGNLWPFEGDAPDTEADNGSTISNRIKKSSAEGQEIMITACCAPSTYNTSGKPWDLDNSRVKDAREQAYADRVAELVARHPEIKYVQVWNEFKGYWGTDAWDAAAYTRFYNKVYAAVKAERPTVLVGGGYVVFSANAQSYFNRNYNGAVLDKRGVEALQYWLDNTDGFDAIALDAFVSPDEFPMIMSYVRSLPAAKNKPLWWSEFYNRPTPDASFSLAGSPYEVAQKIAPLMKEGDISLYWAERRYIPDPNKLLY